MPTISQIQAIVASSFGVSVLDLVSRRQAISDARPRQVAMWLARHTTVHSLPTIGRQFGGRDHSTVMHAIRRIDELRADPAFCARVGWLLKAVEDVDNVEKTPMLRVVA